MTGLVMLKADLVAENERLRAEVTFLRGGLEGVDQNKALLNEYELSRLRVENARLRASYRATIRAQRSMCDAVCAWVEEAPDKTYQDGAT